jgi:hypothetical protein
MDDDVTAACPMLAEVGVALAIAAEAVGEDD